MKTNILLVAALALSVSAFAQCSCGSETGTCPATNTGDKLAGSNAQTVGNFRVSGIDPTWVTGHYNTATAVITKDGYKMVGNVMYEVRGGQQNGMFNYSATTNGDLVLINGVVITATGQTVFLKNGDSIDMQGIFTHNPAPDYSVAAK
jgi:hypothetical protein